MAFNYRICPIDDIGNAGIWTGFERVSNRSGRRYPPWLPAWCRKTLVGVGGAAPELSEHGYDNLSCAWRADRSAGRKWGRSECVGRATFGRRMQVDALPHHMRLVGFERMHPNVRLPGTYGKRPGGSRAPAATVRLRSVSPATGRATSRATSRAEPASAPRVPARAARGRAPRPYFLRNRNANRAIRGTNIGRSRRLS